MEFNFNSVSNQPISMNIIPKGTKLFVKLNVFYPPKDKVGSSVELFRRNSGIEQLCVKLTVVKGMYKGSYFFHSFNICNAQNEGHIRAIEVSKKQLRALVEANWNIFPNDTSEEATKLRMLKSLTDLENYVFPIVVGVELSNQGLEVNKIASIVTLMDEDYQTLLTQGEILT